MAIAAADVLPEQRLRDSYVKHSARAQLYRLFAAIDGGTTASDMFDDPAAAAHMLVAACAHPIDNCRIDVLDRGRIGFRTPDGSLEGEFVRGDAFLPRLNTLVARSGCAATPAAASAHRVRAAVHYFIALVENPARDPILFREVLGATFKLDYTPSPMTELAAVDAWVKGALSSVVASEHDIHAIDVEPIGNGRMTAQVRMTSQALFPDGSGAISRNTQRWTLSDAPVERFPRISEIQIARDAVEFFGPAPDYEPRDRPKPR